MKAKEFFGKHKKKIVMIAASAVVILVIAAVAVFFFLRKNGGGSMPFGQGNFNRDGMTIGEGMVGASGITSVGLTQENFEVEGLTEGVLVEEVYASSGTEIKEGDKILKLSEDSVASVREELEEILKSADLAYRAGAIEYEQNKITIRYDRDMAVLEGEQAKQVYEETVSSLSSSVDRAKQELDDTNEQIAEYREIVNGKDFYETFNVGEYEALYDENYELLVAKMEEWGATWQQVTSGAGQMGGFGSNANSGAGAMSRSVSGSDAGRTASSDEMYVLQLLYQVLEQNLEDLNQAKADYEDAAANAQLNLQSLELSVSTLEKNLSEAKANYETQVLQAKLTMEQTLAAAERAESDYETAMEKAESDYETLKDAKEDAETNLELFESCVGDGYYYASQSGTILRVMTRAGQYLNSDSTIFMYSNPEEMTVTVSVDQADIASIGSGDVAYVESAEYGSFRGEVTEINPVSQSDSRTNVTYNVTVALTGDVGGIGTNETVTVIFGIGGGTNEETN